MVKIDELECSKRQMKTSKYSKDREMKVILKHGFSSDYLGT